MGSALSYVRSLAKPSTMAKADLADVKKMIDSDKVVIFSKTYCPYCKMAKDVFDRLKQKFTVYELDERNDGGEIQNTLCDLTGAKSVPRVFINGKFIGGGTDIQAREKDGTLQEILAE